MRYGDSLRSLTTFFLSGLVLCFSGCDGDKRMVDMTYRATVETVGNDCDDYRAPDDMTVLVDMFLRSDGTMSFRNDSSLIPGVSKYGEIVVTDGKVDHTYAEDAAGDAEFLHVLKGSVSDEAIDLTLSAERRDTSSGTFRKCTETARIVGTRRPLWDPSELDGLYRVRYDFYGEVCPGDTQEITASWNVPLSADPYRSDRVLFRFDEEDVKVIFETEVGANGTVSDDAGTLYIVTGYGYAELDLEVDGTAAPGLVDLSMRYRDPAGAGECYWRLDARGGKVLPDPSLEDNHFRVALRETDDCYRDEPFVQHFEVSAATVTQDDGMVTLIFGGRRYDLGQDGDRVHGSFVSTDGTATLDIEGVLAPPMLEAELDFTYNIGTDFECRDLFEMSGYARYFIPEEGTGFGVEEQEISVRPSLIARPALVIPRFNRGTRPPPLADPGLTFRSLNSAERRR